MMTLSTVGRWTLAFWLEALLIGSCLTLLGWMSAGLSPLLAFTVISLLLLIAGSWLYQGGGRSLLLHLLLYPTVLGVGLFSYYMFGSWLIALLLAGLYYWRIHSVSADGIGHANLQRRFVLALMVCLMQLVVAGVYGSVAHPDTFDPGVYYEMLMLILGSFLLVSMGAYVLREESLPVRLSAKIRMTLGGQVLGSRLLLIALYLAGGSALLGLLQLLWSWLKGPIGSALYFLLVPLLKVLTEWMEGLSEKMGKDRRVTDLLNNQGQGEEMPHEQVNAGEPLISMLEPYLIAAVILVFLIILGRYMWKRRYQAIQESKKEAVTASPTVYTPVSSVPDQDDTSWDVANWFKKPIGPTEEPARYAYFQFLQEMAKQGFTIHRHETSQEFLRRIQRHPLPNPNRLELASRITGYYEQYRYQEQSLRDTDLEAMQEAVQALRSISPPPTET
ncbi:DUF4129 domain-containing protein [Brevibacillus reuszeri]|uniref:DUF4129 domain-containing protein n=1 Tax=Brevibacillus reuszeri TaxID=54915 RepID=UPI002899FA94|nr:DUF4129 domain-containing protein [Brevibacillus reuszeri]